MEGTALALADTVVQPWFSRESQALVRADLEPAIEEIHAACHAWALSCCRWDRSEAEDVLQTAYLKILDGRAIYGGTASFRTWVFAVIRNTAADRRRRHHVATLGLSALFEAVRALAPRHGSGEPTDRLAVRRAISDLPARQREVLDLVFFHGMTLDEAAAAMSISPGAARVHYHRAKTRLSEVLS